MRLDKIFHVISNTHWDREWRFPFQKNRQLLVDMIDKAIEILEKNAQYRAYHLDNQTIVIQDYLEIKPQNERRIKKLVESGRLLIGPWHILPEEFQVGGENLIRNLLTGHRIAASFGKVCKSGYSPFSWGQISQLPQIYQGFGIQVIMFYRGINALKAPNAEFIWEGADGTRSITSRFSTMPRYNFYFYIYRPVFHNELFADVEYTWEKGGTPFHFADTRGAEEDYTLVHPPNEYYRENIGKSVEALVEKQADDFTTPHVIWMEGHDSSGPNAVTTKIIEDIKKIFPRMDVRHSTLEEYAELLVQDFDTAKVPVIKGEMRYSQYDHNSGNLYGYTTSARMYLKQANFETENLLQFYAEPFDLLSGLLGRDNDNTYISRAWEFLIQNSAHDSIGGCSLDAIHDDMMNRYKQANEICRGVYERSLKHIIAQLKMPAGTVNNDTFSGHPLYLTVVNPTNYRRTETVEAIIDIPASMDKGSFTVLDSNNNPLPTQLIDDKPCQPVLEQMTNRPMYLSMRRFRVYLHIPEVLPFGCTVYSIIPERKKRITEAPLATPHNNSFRMENDFLQVAVNANGTLTVKNKETSKRFSGLAYFADEGEAGHAWVNTPVKPLITTKKSKPVIRLIENGILSATVLIKHKLKLPINLTERKKKKGKVATCDLLLYVTLRRGSRRVDMKAVFDNRAEDHRLRIHFPSGINAQYHAAEGQFDIVKRPVVRSKTDDWVEQPMYDFPLHHFVDLQDKQNACALIVDGLKEYEVFDDKRRTVALTLLRAFHYIIQPSSVQDYGDQKGSQCPGRHTYRFSFYPHNPTVKEPDVYREALAHNLPLTLLQSGSNESGTLETPLSFLSIKPDILQFSTLKKAEDNSGAVILRIYNPAEINVEGTIQFALPVKSAMLVDLEENFIEKAVLQDNNSIRVEAGSKKIITIKLELFQNV